MARVKKIKQERAKKLFVDTTTDGFKVAYRFNKRVPSSIFDFVKKHYIIKEALRLLQEMNDQLERKP